MKKIHNLDIKYAFIQVFYLAAFCAMMGFASVYLLDQGFSNSTIGIVLSVVSVIAVFSQPIVASFSDSHKTIPMNRIVGNIVLLIIALSVCLYVIPKNGILVLCLVVGIFSLINTIMPLMNSLAFIFEQKGIEVNYGLARGLGSVAYACSSLLLGNVVNMYNPSLIPLFYILFSVLLYLVLHIYVLPKTYKDVQVENDKVKMEEIPQVSFLTFCKKYKKFILLLAGFVLVYFTHTIINNFFIQIITNVHGDAGDMGNAIFLAAMLELPTMALFTKLNHKVNCGTLIKISIILFSIKHVCTFLASNVMMIYVAQAFQMGAYALFIPASVYYVKAKMQEEDMNKGQSLVTMAMTLSGIFANLMGGFLLDSVGVINVLFIGSIISVIGSIVVILMTERV